MQYIKDSVKPLGTLLFMLTSMIVSAQEKIKISKEEIGTWFERNWMWVAIGAVALILLIALLSRGTVSRLGSRRTTTVIKDDRGKTKSVVTTEEPIKLS
jgi:cell division protein FtsW (lipid II flippase)